MSLPTGFNFSEPLSHSLYQYPILVSKQSETLTDFLLDVLVTLDMSYQTGEPIYVTDASNTVLPSYTVSYDVSTGKLNFIVRVTLSSTQDTILYLVIGGTSF